jgi:DNA invertase Pin-like site-specific DNA recombinase
MTPQETATPRRAAIYARESKGGKRSIKTQLRLGRARAETEDWHASFFRDVMSASPYATSDRDDWPRIVTLMRDRELDLIWLCEQSRGGRVADKFITEMNTCARLGVLVYIEDDERLYDPGDDQDWEALAGQAVKDQAESARTSRRTTRAKKAARADGKMRTVVGHGPPVGFRDGADDWETDPAHAAMLREVAQRIMPPFEEDLADAYAAATATTGPLYRNIAESARAKGRTRGDLITLKMLRKTLVSPVTAGLMCGPPVKDERGRWVRRGEIIRQVIDDPPLPRETWDELQRFLSERARGRRPNADVYPFGKVLACGKVRDSGEVCGNQLAGWLYYGNGNGSTAKGAAGAVPKPMYRCGNQHKIPGTNPPVYQKPCGGVIVPADELNATLKAAVADWWEANADAFEGAGQDGAITAERDALIGRRERLEHQSEVFARKWLDGEWDDDRYGRMDADVKAALARVADELTALDESEAAAAETTPGLPDELEHFDDLSAVEKQRWVRKAFVTPIRVSPAYGTGRKLATDERLRLIPRDLP